MAPQRGPHRAAKPLLAAAFLTFVFLATLLCAASWSVRSEARGAEKTGRRTGYSYGFDRGGRELSYALIGRESNVQMGTGGPWDDFDRLRDQYDQDLLWFSIRGKRFIVLDEGVLDEARRLVAPMNELGARQGRLGAQQAQIGGKQAAIGAKQAVLGARQAALSTRLASLSLEGTRESEQAAIEEALEDLGRRMDALGRQMEPLAREQEELGARQSELGRQMERLTERVNTDMHELVDEAIEAGKARPLRD
jgi:bla regulator protein blaR1